MTEKTTSEILAAAADQLEGYGWCPNVYEGPSESIPYIPMCIWSALHVVINGPNPSNWYVFDQNVTECIGLVRGVLGLQDGGSVVEWNCARERTGQEVIAALREAAAVTA